MSLKIMVLYENECITSKITFTQQKNHIWHHANIYINPKICLTKNVNVSVKT